MRCLVVADLHCSLPQLDWLVSAAPQFDLVIFAGDAQWIDLGATLKRSAAYVEEPPDWLTSLGRITDPSLARPRAAAG